MAKGPIPSLSSMAPSQLQMLPTASHEASLQFSPIPHRSLSGQWPPEEVASREMYLWLAESQH